MFSSRQFELHDDAAEVKFTGLLPLKALRRRLVIPYVRVTSVSTEPFDRRDGLLRVAGFAFGDSLHGLFRRHGCWLFLSFEDPCQVVSVGFDSEGGRCPRLSEIVVQVPEPDSFAVEFEGHAAAHRSKRPGSND